MVNRRQLVLKALAKEEPFPLPYHLDLTDAARATLAEHFGDPDFEETVGNAVALARNETFTEIDEGHEQDMFGVVWRKDPQGDFGQVVDYQLTEPSLKGYEFPKPDEAVVRRKCEALAARQPRQFTMYTIGFSLFERAWTLRGMENILMDFVLHPEFVDALLEHIVQYNCEVMDIVCQYPEIDGIFFGDDWGQQHGLIMGPAHWRRFLRPHLQTMYSYAQRRSRYVAQHSCGDIAAVFPDLVELGLDIYNTFQPEIFDIAAMKRTYGRDLTFYGGISTQVLLPKEPPDIVRGEMRRIMDLLGREGGYIVAPTHAMPHDIPLENMLAFLDVVQNQ